MKMRMILSMLTALTIGGNMAAQTHQESTRVDFYNRAGQRAWSEELDRNSSVSLFTASRSENGWFVNGSQTQDENTGVGSLKFVPWGTERYDLSIEAEFPVEYTVIPAAGAQSRVKASAEKELNVLCGDTVACVLELPQGAYPTVKWLNEYTDVLPNKEPFWNTETAVPFGNFHSVYFNPTVFTSVTGLKELVDLNLHGPGMFQKDESGNGKNVWNLKFVMPNGPCRLQIGYAYLDARLLKNVVDMTLYGLYTQYLDLNWNCNNGESYILQTVGDMLSQDLVYSMAAMSFTPEWFDYIKKSNSYLAAIPWADYYSLIVRANMILENLDLFSGVDGDEKEIARAQLLALRGHCYTRILQIYGHRWSESDGGRKLCAPLILSCTDIQQPLATMNDIYRQVEADLTAAENVFRAHPAYKRTDIIQPDLDVVLAFKMRLYVLGQEWAKVSEVGTEILEHYPISTNADIASGFYMKRDSWIWGASSRYTFGDGTVNEIYFFAPQNFNACNGTYAASWHMGANAIDRNLYLKIAGNDVRLAQFAMPEQLTAKPYSRLSTWYDSKYVIPSQQLFAALNGNWENATKSIARQYESQKPEYAVNGAFQSEFGYVPVPFGAQVKFYGTGHESGYDIANPDAGTLFLRSDEVLLSTAEAAANMGDMAAAQKLLTQLNGQRNPGYNCTATGHELFEEIMTTRRIELWGEGHGWFDFKRWNLPIHRNLWVEGDTESGNWAPNIATDVAVGAANGWRFPIPAYYVKQNPNIDIEAMGYKDVTGYQPQGNAKSIGGAAAFQGTDMSRRPVMDRTMHEYEPAE